MIACIAAGCSFLVRLWFTGRSLGLAHCGSKHVLVLVMLGMFPPVEYPSSGAFVVFFVLIYGFALGGRSGRMSTGVLTIDSFALVALGHEVAV